VSNRNVIETIARRSSWQIRRAVIAIISLGFRHGISLQFAVYLAGRARCHRLPRSFHREPKEPRYRDDPNIYPNVPHESLITSYRAEHFFVRGPLRSIGSHLEHWERLIGVAWLKGSPREPIGYRSMIPFWAVLQELHERGRDLDFLKRGARRFCFEIHLEEPIVMFYRSVSFSSSSKILRYLGTRCGQRLELEIEKRTGRFEKWSVVK